MQFICLFEKTGYLPCLTTSEHTTEARLWPIDKGPFCVKTLIFHDTNLPVEETVVSQMYSLADLATNLLCTLTCSLMI
jgi:hypothetical protein